MKANINCTSNRFGRMDKDSIQITSFNESRLVYSGLANGKYKCGRLCAKNFECNMFSLVDNECTLFNTIVGFMDKSHEAYLLNDSAKFYKKIC